MAKVVTQGVLQPSDKSEKLDPSMNLEQLDRIFIKDLLVRGIVGINPDERVNRQDILVNATFWVDTRPAGKSDQVEDTVNYRTAAKAMMAHIESHAPFLVEKLAADLVAICFETDRRIQQVELTVEKPGAVRFSQSVGLTIVRSRAEFDGDDA